MRKKILIIEDDKDILDIVSVILEQEGYKIETLTHGDVIDEIKADPPELILCDIWLPKRKGTEICKVLKSDSQTSHIPFILISTAMNLSELARKCGADAYIEKPFQIRELVNIVKTYL
jgi:two-component system response regulator VicR